MESKKKNWPVSDQAVSVTEETAEAFFEFEGLPAYHLGKMLEP